MLKVCKNASHGESIHANTMKATFGCSEAHAKVNKTYFVVWNFFMKPRASYEYMDTRMLIGLVIFLVKCQPMVSFFFGSGVVSWSSKKQPTVALLST
jgi:hypothetical protein